MSTTLGIRAEPAVPTPAAETARALYERHGQRVFTFCFSRLRNREEAQDAAQTTFIYALQSLQRGVVPQFELAWLLKIAHNVCRSTRRTAARRATSPTADLVELPDLMASASAEANERLAGLHDALSQLPENQRRAILLREWQGLSYADIAEQLGLTIAAVETLIFRARRGLSERLEPTRRRVSASVLDVGSLLAPLRALLDGVLGKLAVAAAGVSLALAPVVAKDIVVHGRRGTADLTPAAAAAAVREPRTSSVRPVSTGPHPRPNQHRSQAIAIRSPHLPQQPRSAAAAPKPPVPKTPHAGSTAPAPPPSTAPDPPASTTPPTTTAPATSSALPQLDAVPSVPLPSLLQLPSAPQLPVP